MTQVCSMMIPMIGLTLNLMNKDRIHMVREGSIISHKVLAIFKNKITATKQTKVVLAIQLTRWHNLMA